MNWSHHGSRTTSGARRGFLQSGSLARNLFFEDVQLFSEKTTEFWDSIARSDLRQDGLTTLSPSVS